jgi:hypothetical protein
MPANISEAGVMIERIQRRLAELGIDPGPIDGRMGPKTKAAIRAFQRLHGLTADGIAGPRTQAALWPTPIPERDSDPPDPVPAQSKPVWPRQQDVASFFGAPGKRQVMLELPFPMRLAWDKRQPIKRFSIHELVHDSAARAFARIAEEYDEAQRQALGIDLFGGCLNVRPMRGGTRLSMHAWGIAIDFDPARNQLRWGRDKARLALPDANRLWQIWEAEGWVSLGRTRNFDYQHVQAARL